MAVMIAPLASGLSCIDGVKDERCGIDVRHQRDGIERFANGAGVWCIDDDDQLALGSRPWISQPASAAIAASTSPRFSGRACTRMLAISPPGGAITRSESTRRPEMNSRRSMMALELVAVVPVMTTLNGGRTGRAGHDLRDPNDEAVTAYGRDCESRHQKHGEEQKRKDFHAPAARSLVRVVIDGRHYVSRSALRTPRLPAAEAHRTLQDNPTTKLTQINALPETAVPQCEVRVKAPGQMPVKLGEK